MPPAGLRTYVEALPGTPLPHGILGGCAEIIDVTDMHQLLGVEWLALGCCPVRDTDWCGDVPPPGTGSSLPKEFCRPEIEHAVPHSLYAGIECTPIGWTQDEALAHVEGLLDLGAQRALEEAFWRDTLTAQAIDLTPAEGAVSVSTGVAALEGCLADSYGGIGVLHIPAGVAALLGRDSILTLENGVPRTMAGNCAVIGAGYSINTGPGGIPAEPGTAWLYITGPLQIRRGPVDVLPVERGQAIDTRFNDLRLLAEQTYVVGTTCTVCAILVTLC